MKWFKENWLKIGLFFITFIYSEVVLKCITGTGLTVGWQYIFLFSIAYTLFCSAIYSIFSKSLKTVIGSILLLITSVFYIAECLIYRTFHVFMSLQSIFLGAGGVTTDFASDMKAIIFGSIWIMIIFLLPVLVFIILSVLTRTNKAKLGMVKTIIIFVCSILVFIGSVFVAGTSVDYKDEFEFNKGIQHFGLIEGLRLGVIRSNGNEFFVDNEQEQPEKEIKYGKNKLNIDFETLMNEDPSFKDMDTLVKNTKASSKNKYTGIFKGKNLIMICLEGFSGHVIDKELTPTLYRLQHQGFYFSNAYQPTWGGSTSTGEYSFLTGLIPTNALDTVDNTMGHNLYFTMGNQMQRIGYYTGSYHNGSATFYNRDKTHTNFGFNYFLATGNGLEKITKDYPSDEEMLVGTLDTYVDKQPFCMYYMSVDGHSPYNNSSDSRVKEHKKRVKEVLKDKKYSADVINYICYQMELEDALSALLNKLEENGILDDTVICMVADHYPYGLDEGSYGNTTNYVQELYGHEITYKYTQDENAIFLWSKSLEEGGKDHDLQCEISAPTYSLDIVPTLSNLFGLKYDSRMLVGRDVFSDSLPIVVWQDYSWLTEKGYYSSVSHEYIPFTDEEQDDEYVEKMSKIARNKVNFSSQALDNDYYRHVFKEDKITDSTDLWKKKYQKKNN